MKNTAFAKLTKAVGELLEKAPESPTPNGAAGITDAYQRLGALMKKVTDGALPDGAAAELKTIAGMLLAVAGDTTAAAAANAGTENPGVPNVPVADGVATKRAKAAIAKLELDDYTAIRVTIDSACSRLWGVQDLLRSNKMDDAMTELSGITSALNNLANATGGATQAAPAAEKAMTKRYELTKAEFHTWMNEQLEAAKTEEPAVAHARLSALKAAVDNVKKDFERTSAEPTVLPIEVADAYAPNKMGTAIDLTTKTDQVSSESPATAGLPNGGGESPGEHNFGSSIGAVSSALSVAMNTLTTDGGPMGDLTFKADGSPIEKNDASFLWPSDMNHTDPDLVDKKSEKASRPDPVDAMGWGKDPWSNAHR